MVGKKLSYLAVIIVSLFLVACGSEEESNGLSGSGVPTIAAVSQKAVPVEMDVLLENQPLYQGINIEIAGRYGTIPLQVCAEKPRYAPVSWQLTDEDGGMIYATGLDDSLKRLAAPGLPLLVQGRWQYWQGPVGCGKGAPVKEYWYLTVDKLISPNPLVLSVPTADPSLPEQPTVVANLPTQTPTIESELATEEPTPEGTELPTEESATATIEPTETATPLSTSVSATETATATPSPTSSGSSATATNVPTETPTAVAGATETATAVATATVQPTNTPLGSGATNTPVATATTGSGSGFTITVGETKSGTLASAQIDIWDFVVAADGSYKITVEPLDGGDMVYVVKKSDGSFEVEVDDFADGWEESAVLSLTAGNYTITVTEYDTDPALYEISIISQ